MYIDYYCPECEADTTQNLESLDSLGVERHLNDLGGRVTCRRCGHQQNAPFDELSERHQCYSNRDWCYCDDTRHQHCDGCGRAINHLPWEV